MKHRDPLIDAALSSAAGAALVLDAGLRVRFATQSAARLLGCAVPDGVSAPALLCGDAPKRPVAEALAAGRSIQAVIPKPGSSGAAHAVRVRSYPLRDGGAVIGALVTIEDAGDASAAGPELFFGMWTQDAAMKRLFRIIERVAEDDVTVLVRGDTGAGKELVAGAVHALSARRNGPFRAINCAALPGNLLESELFGHAKGAFTGAFRDTPGHLQLAHKGTLFLDEVAELPLDLQAKLLRVLETRAVVPVGGREPIAIDVRVVSATHRALRVEAEAGRFRADLMYRLRVIPVFLPPLRDRAGDVALLVDKLVAELNPRSRRKVERVSPGALRALERYDWPGNVRELKNVLTYAFAIGDGPELSLGDLPTEVIDLDTVAAAPTERAGALDAGSTPEARRIARALERTSGNREHAAKLLGISRVTLWRRMKELSLDGAHEDPARPKRAP